ncbi:hypothetical protein DVH02_06105 [Streptomyces corynorhini]|uniref:Uncharacterized protein n=1 Tax=Streptomyces corynorhini TaxID=2282652 RepID=A0A370BB55_9ACTN|nr:hypothetical protein DVH02_06105 [Streptomyces corynorhini]
MATQTATHPPATKTDAPSPATDPPAWTLPLPAGVPGPDQFAEPDIELMLRVRRGLRRWAA